MKTPKSNTVSESRSKQKGSSIDHTKRKRELDRIAQRSCRERTKNRINFLEEKVRSLEAQGHGDQFSSLMAKQEALLKNNTQLRAALMKIRFIADSILSSSNSDSCENWKDSSSGTDSAESPEAAPEELKQQCTTEGSQQSGFERSQPPVLDVPDFEVNMEPDLEQPNVPLLAQDLSLDNIIDGISVENEFFTDDTLALGSAISCDPDSDRSLASSSPNFDISSLANWQDMSFDWNILSLFGSNGLSVVPHEEMWTFSDGAFIRGLQMTCTEKSIEKFSLDSSVPVQAILFGWDTIDANTRKHPAWVALRDIDEKVFGSWTSKPQKIAMMYVCSLVMQYRVDPSPENLEKLPVWFRPRPGLREFLVFNHMAYTQTGEFSQRFTEDLNFNWPFPETAILDFNAATGHYGVSKLFKDYVYNLGNWTMDPRFFEKYKELMHDIPVNLRKGTGAGLIGGMDNGLVRETVV